MTDDPFAMKPQIYDKGGTGANTKRVLSPRETVHEPVHKGTHDVDMSQWDDFIYDGEREDDRLKIPGDVIPEGMDYQWVTLSIFGKAMPQRVAEFQRSGWRPVMAARHDGMFMEKGNQGAIEVDGMGLFERPLKFSQIARQRDQRKAREQVDIRERQLRGGDVPGVGFDTQHPSAKRATRVNKTYERIPVPEE